MPGKELARPEARSPAMAAAIGALRDVQRLPLLPAADMVALTLQTHRRTGPAVDRELEALCLRLEESRADPCVLPAALTLLDGFASLPAVGGLSTDAAAVAVRCAMLVAAEGSAETAAQLVDRVLRAPVQLGAALVSPVVGVARARLGSAPVVGVVRAWLEHAPPWREDTPAEGRDVAISAVVLALAATGDVGAAAELAQRWPPTRTPLTKLVGLLLRAGYPAEVAALARRYRPEGELAAALLGAVIEVASAADEAPSPELSALLRELLDAQRPRPRDRQRALELLQRGDPLGGFLARARQLVQKTSAWSGAGSVRRLREDVAAARSAAADAGEPGLAEDLLAAIRANTDEPSLLAALRGL